jgi:hypothetical protein
MLKHEPILEGLEVGGFVFVDGDGQEEWWVEVLRKRADSNADMNERRRF